MMRGYQLIINNEQLKIDRLLKEKFDEIKQSIHHYLQNRSLLNNLSKKNQERTYKRIA
jgi:glutathionyl-hydroquinone reductase